MPTTFNVFSLGNLADIDTTEGNTNAENASALAGLTFGSIGDPLVNDVAEWAPGTGGFGGGTSTAYDMDNSPAENFTIDGGADQVFDGTAVYNATITYIDGTTASITAVIAQDTAGNTYWMPEFSANADQTAMEAAAIRSLTLDSVNDQTWAGTTGNRQTWDFVTCFAQGVKIETPAGPIPVEALSEGNLVSTRDNGAQPIRWLGRSEHTAGGGSVPVRIAKGALGDGLPEHDITVSQQHRMMINSKIVERLTGETEIFVPAKKLLDLPGVSLADDMETVTYFHVLLDRHEVIYAEGAPTESFRTGPQALEVMGIETLCEIETIFPGVIEDALDPARPVLCGAELATVLERHMKNDQPLLQDLARDPRAENQVAEPLWNIAAE